MSKVPLKALVRVRDLRRRLRDQAAHQTAVAAAHAQEKDAIFAGAQEQRRLLLAEAGQRLGETCFAADLLAFDVERVLSVQHEEGSRQEAEVAGARQSEAVSRLVARARELATAEQVIEQTKEQIEHRASRAEQRAQDDLSGSRRRSRR
ncbi:MAG: hypothetical protein IT384_05730 [Deltaproteobacteria bacterium]|nr:hypothetical protein [Deltaproteobacteria bacterium]